MTAKVEMYRVHYTEYERGWGSRPDGHQDFPSQQEALGHQTKFNSRNKSKTVPDYYVIAEAPVRVLVDAPKSKVDDSGTTKQRLEALLQQLQQRFPHAVDPLSSEPPEEKLLAAIDHALMVTTMSLCEVPHIALRPHQRYMFIPIEGCIQCKQLLSAYTNHDTP